MVLLLASEVPARLLRLAPVDVVIVLFYFALVLSIGWYLKGPLEHRRRLFHGGAGDDGVGSRSELSLRQSGCAGTDGRKIKM
jgi:hypothetical protein